MCHFLRQSAKVPARQATLELQHRSGYIVARHNCGKARWPAAPLPLRYGAFSRIFRAIASSESADRCDWCGAAEGYYIQASRAGFPPTSTLGQAVKAERRLTNKGHPPLCAFPTSLTCTLRRSSVLLRLHYRRSYFGEEWSGRPCHPALKGN